MNETAPPAMDPKIAELLAKIAKVKKIFKFLFVYQVIVGLLLLSAFVWGGENGFIGLFVAPFFFGLGYAYKLVATDEDFAHCKIAMRANYASHLLMVVVAIAAYFLLPGESNLCILSTVAVASLIPGIVSYIVAGQMKKATAG
ncbi:MAG: hypothetical protein Q4B48_07330 [Syntrophomonadaceae bacterium]|nr:hypothetical protein [Syntrophomonadaceae bacterium]